MVKTESSLPPSPDPPLWGLVLAGGAGSRIGRDKGELQYHGRPQARWTFDLLAGWCERTYVSVRPEQVGIGVYASLPLIEDQSAGGPAAGLLAAWTFAPDVAWLLLATDMPLIDNIILSTLVEGRRPSAVATAFRHPDGSFEPLCAIWEPGARQSLPGREPSSVSLRGLLNALTASVQALDVGDATRFCSVNTPRDHRKVRARIAARAATPESLHESRG
jgi:molybdopterin-guanine dinucleotide biosynthesis protein A